MRIEDIDFTRCKEKFVKEIIDDINWLKIPFIRTKDQSLRRKYYTNALNKLKSMDLVYPCWLSRKEALDALSAPHHNTLERTNVLLSEKEIIKRKQTGITPAWRLKIKECLEYDKYGRILVKMYDHNNNCINDIMIKEGFGKEYDGGHKHEWF